MQSVSTRVANSLLQIEAVGFNAENPVTFKSGLISPVYVDNRRLPYHNEQWKVIIDGFATLIKEENIDYDVIAGVAVGGVPHSSALGFHINKPSIFIRKEAKGHGKQNRVEGGDINGKRVIMVEDLVTTGGSSLDAAQALQDAGANVVAVITIVSYGFESTKQAFEDAGIALHTLTNFETILQQASEMNVLNNNEVSVISDWFDNPETWAERHNKA